LNTPGFFGFEGDYALGGILILANANVCVANKALIICHNLQFDL